MLLGAALAFSMEPLVGRLLLPRYGGAFYVWATAMTFFQGALLVGYVYAHFVAPRLGRWHLALLVAAAVFLPFQVTDAAAHGTADVFWTLLRIAGVPFVLLASTSVLGQRWLASSRLEHRTNPYPLYAASNIGSLGALLGYALLLEPLVGARGQQRLWSALYAIYVISALLAYRSTTPAIAPSTELERPPSMGALAGWALLAAGPSALALAVTNVGIVEIGNAPLLWVLPLGLYLASFILPFGRVGTPRALVRLLPHMTLVALGSYALAGSVMEGWLVGATCMLLAFAISWSAHGALYDSRPAPSSLGWFYLAIALGGWLGGAFVSLLAPVVFDRLHEFVAAIAVTALAVTYARKAWRMSKSQGWTLAAIALSLLIGYAGERARSDRVVAYERSPYGVYCIVETARSDGSTLRRLISGQTSHGVQYHAPGGGLDPAPTLYYHPATPLGQVVAALPRPRRLGVVGLGVGTIAGLLTPGDSVVFYEIDALVTELARKDFSYLSAPVSVEVRTGDARQLLASESSAGAPRYQLLVVDAFTGDGIPVHLLTTEALQLYRDRVEPGAPVLLHISNRFLRLEGVIGAAAGALGVPAFDWRFTENLAPRQGPSHYALLGETRDPRWKPLPSGGALWTDEHASLVPLWLVNIAR